MFDRVSISFDEFIGLLRGGDSRFAVDVFKRFVAVPVLKDQGESIAVVEEEPVKEKARKPKEEKKIARKKWDDETVLRMIKMKGEGKTGPEIAEHFGTSAGHVYFLVRRYEKHNKHSAHEARQQGIAEHCARAVPKTRRQMIEYLRAAGYKIGMIGDVVMYDGEHLTDDELVDVANKERNRTRLPVFELDRKAA